MTTRFLLTLLVVTLGCDSPTTEISHCDYFTSDATSLTIESVTSGGEAADTSAYEGYDWIQVWGRGRDGVDLVAVPSDGWYQSYYAPVHIGPGAGMRENAEGCLTVATLLDGTYRVAQDTEGKGRFPPHIGVEPLLELDHQAGRATFTYERDGMQVVETWRAEAWRQGP